MPSCPSHNRKEFRCEVGTLVSVNDFLDVPGSVHVRVTLLWQELQFKEGRQTKSPVVSLPDATDKWQIEDDMSGFSAGWCCRPTMTGVASKLSNSDFEHIVLNVYRSGHVLNSFPQQSSSRNFWGKFSLRRII